MITSLKDKITKFEKYCMVCMIARRAYAQDTIAAIYDRDRSSISRYMSVWLSKLGEGLSKLGEAGHDLSELDMEMNFNHMTIEDAQATGTPYMKDSEACMMRDGEEVELSVSELLAMVEIEEEKEGEFKRKLIVNCKWYRVPAPRPPSTASSLSNSLGISPIPDPAVAPPGG